MYSDGVKPGGWTGGVGIPPFSALATAFEFIFGIVTFNMINACKKPNQGFVEDYDCLIFLALLALI
jgi:hypothetical protein